PYINRSTLLKTLPYLTYLSVLNYTATKEGSIKVYYDDTEIIQLAKAYRVVPLMLLTTLTIQGEANIRTDFDLLLNEEFQNRQLDNILNILETKGYMGINISLQYLSVSNIKLYESYITKVTNRLNAEGYQVFVTINPNISDVNSQIAFEKIDYTLINEIAQNIIFMSYEWAYNPNPPSPISSVKNMESFLSYVLQYIPSQKIIIGIATIGYDWELPYVTGISNIRPISYDRFVNYASNYGATIKFDETSQTPYFTFRDDENIDHSVWFIDARSIYATLQLVSKYNLNGISIWNITIYNPQLWLIINSQYEIEKVI
ncbi:MAG TPA: glycosyl hydrolase family 18 protein, partial [Lachnospiraceae bacterium]|nr:glycosyl hydrolase family 18 protein [Lachnospiraceae bacterium]